jgi:hypothetical protein
MSIVRRPRRVKLGKSTTATYGKNGVTHSTRSGRITTTSSPSRGLSTSINAGNGVSIVTRHVKPTRKIRGTATEKLIGGLIAAGALWAWSHFGTDRQSSTQQGGEFRVTSEANVRSNPSVSNSEILGQLDAGNQLEGSWVEGPGGSRWLHISEGPYAGSFLWSGNIVENNPAEK